MAEPRTSDNLSVSEEFPIQAMLAFMMMHGRNPKANPQGFTPQLNHNIAQIIFDMVLDDSARTLLQVGLVSPPQSPSRLTLQVPGAPKAPSRPQSLALAVEAAGGSQASGQPLPTAVRALVFGAVPAGVPDA